jgi:hypothetical protein
VNLPSVSPEGIEPSTNGLREQNRVRKRERALSVLRSLGERHRREIGVSFARDAIDAEVAIG